MKKAMTLALGTLFSIPSVAAFDPRLNLIGDWINSLFTPDWLMFRILFAILLFIIYFLVSANLPMFKDEGNKITKGPRLTFSLILAILSTWAIPVNWITPVQMTIPGWLAPFLVIILTTVLIYFAYGNEKTDNDNRPGLQLYRAILFLIFTGAMINLANQSIFGYNLSSPDSIFGLLMFFTALVTLLLFFYKLINFLGLVLGRGGESSGSFSWGLPKFSWDSSPEAKEKRKEKKRKKRIRKETKILLKLLRRYQGTLALHQKKINARKSSLIDAIQRVSKK